AAAEAAHAVADIEKERFALLLAIVADVDAGFDLFVDDLAQRLLAETVELGRIDLATPRPPHIEARQLRRPRQAARVRRQDPLVTPVHNNKLPVTAAGLRRVSRGR